MDKHNILTEAEEMYLVRTALLLEAGEPGPVPISHLAEEMGVLPVSVNQMVRKLENSGYLTYTPYKGVAFTAAGRHYVNQILRRRRLWEVFLVEKLQIHPQAADELACRLEHSIPADVAERLAEYLGQPHLTPTGANIPGSEDGESYPPEYRLSELTLGSEGLITSLGPDPATRSFLEAAGLKRGARITVMGLSPAGDFLLETDLGQRLHLVNSIASGLMVTG